jgi:hypothetical protein
MNDIPRRLGRVRKTRLLPSTRVALEKGQEVWLEIGNHFVYVYDNDGSQSATQGLLYTFREREEATQHLVLIKEKNV